MSPTRPPASGRPCGARCGLVYVIWGSTYLGIRVVTESLPRIRLGRDCASARPPCCSPRRSRRYGAGRALRITGRQLGASALVGVLLLGGGNGLVVLAESPRFGLPSGLAALLISLSPVTMVVLRGRDRRPPAAGTVAGVLIGFAGLAALFLPGLGRRRGTRSRWSAACSCCWPCSAGAVGSFATRWLPMPANPFVASVTRWPPAASSWRSSPRPTGEPAVWAVPARRPRPGWRWPTSIVFGR